MSDPSFWVFSDGSCAHTGETVGAWTSCVVSAAGVQNVSNGIEYPTTISRCELIPINAALRWIRCNGTKSSAGRGLSVRLYSDSEYLINVLSGHAEPRKNMDLFMAHAELVGEMRVQYIHRSRNSHYYMQLCDAVCSTMRRKYLLLLNDVLGKSVDPKHIKFVAPPQEIDVIIPNPEQTCTYRSISKPSETQMFLDDFQNQASN